MKLTYTGEVLLGVNKIGNGLNAASVCGSCAGYNGLTDFPNGIDVVVDSTPQEVKTVQYSRHGSEYRIEHTALQLSEKAFANIRTSHYEAGLYDYESSRGMYIDQKEDIFETPLHALYMSTALGMLTATKKYVQVTMLPGDEGYKKPYYGTSYVKIAYEGDPQFEPGMKLLDEAVNAFLKDKYLLLVLAGGPDAPDYGSPGYPQGQWDQINVFYERFNLKDKIIWESAPFTNRGHSIEYNHLKAVLLKV